MTPEHFTEEVRIQFPGLTEAQCQAILDDTPRSVLFNEDRLPSRRVEESVKKWLLDRLVELHPTVPPGGTAGFHKDMLWQEAQRIARELVAGQPLPERFGVNA